MVSDKGQDCPWGTRDDGSTLLGSLSASRTQTA